MTRREYCNVCKKELEVKEVIKQSGDEDIVLKCEHRIKHPSIPVDRLSISDKVSTRIIRFDTEKDRIRGFGILVRSRARFHGIGRNQFVIENEQYNLLKSKEINFTEMK